MFLHTAASGEKTNPTQSLLALKRKICYFYIASNRFLLPNTPLQEVETP